MTDKYFSRFYRGFTLEQTENGWIIKNCPDRTVAGPLTQGPYSNYLIAQHVVDHIHDADKKYNSSTNFIGSSYQTVPNDHNEFDNNNTDIRDIGIGEVISYLIPIIPFIYLLFYLFT